MTLGDVQAARLIGSVTVASAVAVGDDKVRGSVLSNTLKSVASRLAHESKQN
jgi:hypothetical protein